MSNSKKNVEAGPIIARCAEADEKTPLKTRPVTLGGVTSQAAMVRIVTCIVSLAEGYDGAIFGAVATSLVTEFNLTPSTLGFLASLVNMACFVGSPIAGFLMNFIGRKTLLMWVCLIIATGSLMQALAPNVYYLGAGRFILGLGMGMGMTTVTVYVAEVSPKKIRGLLTSLEEIFINIGMTMAFFVSWLFLGPAGIDWRHAMLLGVILPLFAASMMPWSFTPESPRYHLLCGRLDEARLCMRNLGIPDDEAEQTINAWSNPSGGASEQSQSVHSMLNTHKRPLLLAIGVAVSVAASGISPLHNLMPYVLASKMPEEEALRISTIISTLKFLVLIPMCGYFLDYAGRKPLLCCSSSMFAAAAVFVGMAFHNGLSGEIIAVGYGVILCSYSAGMGPAVWPYIAEVLPTLVRGGGTGVSLMCGRIVATIWMFAFPVLFAWQQVAPFYIAALSCLAAFVFFYGNWTPETTQKTLEEIQEAI